MNEIKIINYYISLIKVYSCSSSYTAASPLAVLVHGSWSFCLDPGLNLPFSRFQELPLSSQNGGMFYFPSSIAGIVIVGTQVISRTSRHRRVGLSAIGDAFLKSEIIHVVSTEKQSSQFSHDGRDIAE